MISLKKYEDIFIIYFSDFNKYLSNNNITSPLLNKFLKNKICFDKYWIYNNNRYSSCIKQHFNTWKIKLFNIDQSIEKLYKNYVNIYKVFIKARLYYIDSNNKIQLKVKDIEDMSSHNKIYKHANLILISNPIIKRNFRNYEEQIIKLNTILTNTLNYNINKQDISEQIDNIKKNIINNKTNLTRLKNLLKLDSNNKNIKERVNTFADLNNQLKLDLNLYEKAQNLVNNFITDINNQNDKTKASNIKYEELYDDKNEKNENDEENDEGN